MPIRTFMDVGVAYYTAICDRCLRVGPTQPEVRLAVRRGGFVRDSVGMPLDVEAAVLCDDAAACVLAVTQKPRGGVCPECDYSLGTWGRLSEQAAYVQGEACPECGHRGMSPEQIQENRAKAKTVNFSRLDAQGNPLRETSSEVQGNPLREMMDSAFDPLEEGYQSGAALRVLHHAPPEIGSVWQLRTDPADIFIVREVNGGRVSNVGVLGSPTSQHMSGEQLLRTYEPIPILPATGQLWRHRTTAAHVRIASITTRDNTTASVLYQTTIGDPHSVGGAQRRLLDFLSHYKPCALLAYQTQGHLDADGICGIRTRLAMTNSLWRTFPNGRFIRVENVDMNEGPATVSWVEFAGHHHTNSEGLDFFLLTAYPEDPRRWVGQRWIERGALASTVNQFWTVRTSHPWPGIVDVQRRVQAPTRDETRRFNQGEFLDIFEPVSDRELWDGVG